MKIDVNLTLDKEFVENSLKGIPSAKAAYGWVEIEETFKFPITILSNKQNKAWVKYPSVRKNENEYTNILFPAEPKVKEEVDAAVLRKLQHLITKGMYVPPVTDVRINLLNEGIKRGSITTKAMASIKICGFVINGITVKEGGNGPFVQMPQHTTGEGEQKAYHDTVYGTTSFSQYAIKNAVLEEYEKALKMQTKQEVPVNEQEMNDPKKMISTPKL